MNDGEMPPAKNSPWKDDEKWTTDVYTSFESFLQAFQVYQARTQQKFKLIKSVSASRANEFTTKQIPIDQFKYSSVNYCCIVGSKQRKKHKNEVKEVTESNSTQFCNANIFARVEYVENDSKWILRVLKKNLIHQHEDIVPELTNAKQSTRRISINPNITPQKFRLLCRRGKFESNTSGYCSEYAQANLVILPVEHAFDFLLFCQRNPKSCPLLEVSDPGSFDMKRVAPGSDIRSDIPKYRIYQDGVLTNENLVTFLIGCSFSFEGALVHAGLSIRHQEERKNVPMYRTNIPCDSAGVFSGNLVVSMRPFKSADAILASVITARYPNVHGSPVHIGSPNVIGVTDISKPDYGDAVTIKEDEIPVFWACGVTPQSVLLSSKPAFAITHAPGHMFITDRRNESL